MVCQHSIYTYITQKCIDPVICKGAVSMKFPKSISNFSIQYALNGLRLLFKMATSWSFQSTIKKYLERPQASCMRVISFWTLFPWHLSWGHLPKCCYKTLCSKSCNHSCTPVSDKYAAFTCTWYTLVLNSRVTGESRLASCALVCFYPLVVPGICILHKCFWQVQLFLSSLMQTICTSCIWHCVVTGRMLWLVVRWNWRWHCLERVVTACSEWLSSL